jgi:hypothetical protein
MREKSQTKQFDKSYPLEIYQLFGNFYQLAKETDIGIRLIGISPRSAP